MQYCRVHSQYINVFGSNKEVVSVLLPLLLDPRQLQMAFAFGFPRDTTTLIRSFWDWRYRLVRGGGKTPSASAMPSSVPEHAGYEPITTNMEHGKYYYQRIEGSDGSFGSAVVVRRPVSPVPCERIRPCDLQPCGPRATRVSP